MDQTQRDLAAFLGTTEQTVRLWERNREKPIPSMADRFLRATYLAYLGDLPFRRMLQRLAELDQVHDGKGRFQETANGWKSIKAPPLEEQHAS